MAQSPDNIRAIAFDIDGVMTDGGLISLPDGDLLRVFNAKDTFAVRTALAKGFEVAVFTGGISESIARRCDTLGIPRENVYMGCRGKITALRSFCESCDLQPSEVLYFGDDIPDIPVLRACGLSIAPADAAEEAKAAAVMVSPYPGGNRCVRHGIEMVLKAQGKWMFDEDKYDQIF